jgi:hypothetical protein
MAQYSKEERNNLFNLAYETLGELQLKEDKPYQVRPIAEAMIIKQPKLKDDTIEIVTQRLGALMVSRAKNPELRLEKTRNAVSNDIGGNYFYYIKTA